jgi:hypothetical protein
LGGKPHNDFLECDRVMIDHRRVSWEGFTGKVGDEGFPTASKSLVPEFFDYGPDCHTERLAVDWTSTVQAGGNSEVCDRPINALYPEASAWMIRGWSDKERSNPTSDLLLRIDM